MDLTGYTFEQLIELKNTIEGMIYSYTDGYEYICKVQNYGNTYHINSVEDYNNWKNYHDTEIILKAIEESLIEWENSENKPFNQRPYFKPYWSRDELNEKRVEFENLDKDFIEPKLI